MTDIVTSEDIVETQSASTPLRLRYLSKLKSMLSVFVVFWAICYFSTVANYSNHRFLPPERFWEGDGVRLCRQAEMILQQGHLPEIDSDRWLPGGRSLRTYATFSSYVLVGMYLGAKQFVPGISLNQVAFWYPAICFMPSIFLVYWCCRWVIRSNYALLATALYSFLPIGMQHSVVSYSDRDSLVLTLSTATIICFMASCWYSGRKTIIWYCISAVLMGILSHTWEGCGLFIAIIVSGYLISSLIQDFRRSRSAGMLIWAGIVMLMLPLFDDLYRPPFSAYALLVWFALLFGIFYSFGELLLIYSSSKRESILRYGLILFSFLAPWVLFSVFGVFGKQSFVEHLTSPLGHNRLMSTVMELQKPTLRDWHLEFSVTGFLSIVGVAAISCAIAKRSLHKWGILLGTFAFILFGIILPAIFYDNQKLKPDEFFIIGAVLWGIGLLMGLRSNESTEISEKENSQQNPMILYPYFITWFFITLAAARSSVRFELWLLPISCIITGIILEDIARQLLSEVQATYLFTGVTVALCWGYGLLLLKTFGNPIVVGLSLLCLVYPLLIIDLKQMTNFLGQVWPGFCMFGAFMLGGVYVRQDTSILAIVPEIHLSHLTESLNWLKKNAANRTVMAWWDYGSFLNYFGDVRTVIDEDHYKPYWIYLAARYLYSGNSPEEALSLLYSHNVDYLIYNRNEINKLSEMAYLGMVSSDKNKVSSPNFPLSLKNTITTKKGVRLVYVAPSLSENTFILKDSKEGDLKLTDCTIEVDPNSGKPLDAVVTLTGNSKTFRIRPSFSQVNNSRSYFPKGTNFLGLVTQIDDLKNSKIGWCYFILPEDKQLLPVRLFLLRDEIPGFRPVYYDGITAIWKVEHLPGIAPSSLYKADEFPPDLARMWTDL